ncbi:MAG: N-acetylornithine carbamoyltransferase [Xanthomonadales bacterium]|nr:N-acetylornithine carbamoyltransferase [Xanthomonadales bacterium]
MRHVAAIADLGSAGVREVLALAARAKGGARIADLAGRTLGLLFADPSLRTRASMDQAAHRLGGRALPLELGGSSWKLEVRDDVRMDGDCPEHVREAAPVLSQYVDAIGLRAFSRSGSVAEEEADAYMQAFKRHARVPVFNLESAREHPCQGLADLLTVRERFGDSERPRICLSWAPHRKPLPRAVPNSLLLTAAAMGCEIAVAAPAGYELGPAVRDQAQALAAESGGQIRWHEDQQAALAGAQVLYAKAWGAVDPLAVPPPNDPALSHWMPTLMHFRPMDPAAVLMHCLPVRRDLEVAAEVLDSPRSAVVQQAGNRLWVQMGLLAWLFAES